MGREVLPLFAVFSALLAVASGNVPPSWDESSLDIFVKGINEDTSIGTTLGFLKCTDPDGDPVIYRLTSGTAVRVRQSGQVILSVLLDFEKKDQVAYDLTLECVDVNTANGRPKSQWVPTRTVILPLDANDNAPEFSTSNVEGYTFFVLEETAVGTTLEPPIIIEDKDRSNNAVLDQLYLACNSPYPNELSNLTENERATCDKFSISFVQVDEGVHRASLSVRNPLDYESQIVYRSNLIAVDGNANQPTKLTTTVNIQVNVRDSQDQLPLFTNIGASASVNEKAPIGSTVIGFGISARDGDLGDSRPVKLDIIRDAEDAFELSPEVLVSRDEGIYESKLVVKNQLDREAIATAYEFVVKVTELDRITGNLTDATATATYSVFVTDSNDNAPTFDKEIYTETVIEPINNRITQIPGFRMICNDPDEPTNANYQVRVIEDPFGIYSITPDGTQTGTANLFLRVSDASYLDYDNPSYRRQKIVVEAKEVGTAELLSSTATINIVLRDINDNSPQFSKGAYSVKISETVNQFPFNVLNITATDVDAGNNGLVTYRLEGGTEGLFYVEPETGHIFLNGSVDYEATPQYVFLAYASDKGASPRQTQVQITVDIINANDEGPRFLLPLYQTSVNESRLDFLNPVIVTAVDDEDGTVAITYRIKSGQSPNGAFLMNSRTGELTLQDFLNFEDTPVGPNGKFSGVFELQVEASDNGQPPQTNEVPVRIIVIDVNDHSPVMNPKIYTKELSELAPPGTPVVDIKASDDDGGSFGTLFYRIGQGLSDNFFVDPNSGKITVGQNRQFDVDVTERYELEVIASDGGAPQRSATATVYITLLDGNNKAPEFKELLYYIYVDETRPVDSVVETIRATDADSNSNLEYSIVSIQAFDPDGRSLSVLSQFDYRNAFRVNNQGEIIINRQLSRDQANEISFILQAEDLNTEVGSRTGTTQVTIIIEGEVKTDITFDLATTVYMNENARAGYNAITVTARDPNNNAVSRYEMINTATSSSNFEVKANGRITLVTEVDYENDPQPDHLHRVVVRAINNDGSESATVTATISVVDVNDNGPEFQRRIYETEVPETYVYPMEVASLFATDADSKSYGPLDIRISGGLDSADFQVFQYPPHGGSRTSRRAAVFVAKNTTLDFNRRSEYNLDISVSDNVNEDFSNARLTTNAKLIIRVIDENNNSPLFVESSRNLAVPETAQIGQSIATLIATDKDVGLNGEISYSLESVDQPDSNLGMTLFTIGSGSGTVRVLGNLLGKGGKVYPLRVRARDRGERANSGFMDLFISVQSTEDDDGNPKWIQPVNEVEVTAPEETPDYQVTQPGFFDATARTGTGIQFALSPASDFASSFSINPTTGVITILDSLDREQQEFYNLLVYAEDTSNPSVIRSGRQVVVRLLDQNDNDPTFTNPDNYPQCEAIDRPLTLYVRENIEVNTVVHTLSACDPDSEENSRIHYELYQAIAACRQANTESIIGLNSTTGDLYVQGSVDYEQLNEYAMCVQARPGLRARRKRSLDLSAQDLNKADVAYINFVVVDENDNGPRFPEQELVAVVLAQPETGPVITLAAIDPDSSANNVILYRVLSSVFISQSGEEQASPDVFTLRGASGALYPALPSYQSFSGGRFSLRVQAIDAANPEFTDIVQIFIYVYEEGQAVKLILGDSPADAISYSQEMIKELDNVQGKYSFTYLQVSEHRTDDGIEPDKTDVCFLAVNEDDNTILNIRQIISVLDQDKYRAVLSQSRYNQVDRGQCYPSQSSEEDVRWRDLWWVLVAVAIFIFICCLILLVLICVLYDKYRRYMKTRQTYLVSQ